MSFGPPESLPAPWRHRTAEGWAQELGVPLIEIHHELGSTNERLRELARTGAQPFTTVVAASQSRGRGREGARWVSPFGSGLWISVLLSSEAGWGPGVLPLAVGVAAARSVERLSRRPVELKWPNDLLIHSRKVAGVLCEVPGDPPDGVIVGIGVNLRRPHSGFPDELLDRVAFLEEEAGSAIEDPRLTRDLLAELGRWVQPPPRTLSGPLRAEWEARDCLRGRRVILDSGAAGTAAGVSEEGTLRVLEAEGRLVNVRAGRVRVDEPGGGSRALHAGPRGFEPDGAL